jgi:acyl-coenzyme A synthetase/AMP-(fatty) acid ligase
VLDAGVALPPLALVVSATAPLSPQLAARAENELGAPLLEIYGCTEAGQVATRRTTAGAEWQTFGALHLAGSGDHTVVSGGHVPAPTPLADVLEVLDGQRFRLLGRSNDLVNIAGKRSSIGHLNYHLNAIDGVVDGAFWMPAERAGEAAVVRLVAFLSWMNGSTFLSSIALSSIVCFESSTLTTALVRAGFGFLSNEAAPIDPDTRTVEPFPRR